MLRINKQTTRQTKKLSLLNTRGIEVMVLSVVTPTCRSPRTLAEVPRSGSWPGAPKTGSREATVRAGTRRKSRKSVQYRQHKRAVTMLCYAMVQHRTHRIYDIIAQHSTGRTSTVSSQSLGLGLRAGDHIFTNGIYTHTQGSIIIVRYSFNYTSR